MDKIKCIFCGKDISKEKYNKDYVLLTWADDPDNPESLNKVANPACAKCFKDFFEWNFNIYKDLIE